MSNLVKTGNEMFIVVIDHDQSRTSYTGCQQFAIGPLEDMVENDQLVSRMDQAGAWLRAFKENRFGKQYEALLVLGAVAKRLYPEALEKLEFDLHNQG